MNEDIDVERIGRETYSYFMKDGLTEIFLGIVLLIASVTMFRSYLVVFVVFFVIFGAVVTERIRERHTYPRIGYAKIPIDEKDTDPKGFLVFMVVVIVIFLITLQALYGTIFDVDRMYQWMPTFFGLVMFGPSLFLENKTGDKRYYLLGAAFLSTGVVVSYLVEGPRFTGLMLYLGGWGLAFLVFGVLRALWFVMKNPIMLTEEGEDVE